MTTMRITVPPTPLSAVAAEVTHGLHRLLARRGEPRSDAAGRWMPEDQQHSMLSGPPVLEHLEIAARYLPAGEQAQVGGDWYDAFVVGGRTTSLVVGDVAGHGGAAAAAMGQLRDVLRGVVHASTGGPACTLAALDRAATELIPASLATAVVAQVHPSPHGAGGPAVLRWSNAGHPPPMLLHPAGKAELLSREPELLLGFDPMTRRSQHSVVLRAGSTLLLYTDGLVERRGEDLQAGLERLRRVGRGCAPLPLEVLCDALLRALVGHGHEDDVALLAVRTRREEPVPERPTR